MTVAMWGPHLLVDRAWPEMAENGQHAELKGEPLLWFVKEYFVKQTVWFVREVNIQRK